MNGIINKYIPIILFVCSLLIGCSTKTEQNKVIVYPIPQKLDFQGDWITIPKTGYKLTGFKAIDTDASLLLNKLFHITEQANQTIRILQLKTSDSKFLRSGAYILDVEKEGITIRINDDRSLFYAVQTLSQLISNNKLPICSIKDYPDIVFRGVVEGFYGTPWSFENRIEQLRFYGRMKMNTYIFGPKDDPYHRSPWWRIPYPKDQSENIRKLLIEAKKNKVDFVWALHPGMDIRWNNEDRQFAIKKLESMYELGVRSFAVFFDDIDGVGTDAIKQASFMNYLKKEFVDKKKDIQQLILCPTEYNKDWAKTNYLNILGEQLDPFIQIMWTGDRVVSDITHDGLQWVNQRIKRPCYVWWNYPVNDYSLAHLLMGPVYGLDKNTASDMFAFVSNPMEYAEASKVALWSISQYTWNMSQFNSLQCWEKACEQLVPEAPKDFQLFCEHNADIGPNTWMFFREESFSSKKLFNDFEQAILKGKYLKKEALEIADLFQKIKKASSKIPQVSNNKQLIKEINPWLTQTKNVGDAGIITMRLLDFAQKKDIEESRKAYKKVKEILKSITVFNKTYQKGEQDGIRSGSQVLLPFIHKMLEYVENTLLTDEKPKERPNILANLKHQTELSCYCEDDIVGLTPHFQPIIIGPGEYFGFQIETYKNPIALFYDLRKSKAKDRIFQGSVDGKTWFNFSKEGADRLDTIPIHNPQIRYIRCLNQSKSDISIGIGRFAVATESTMSNDK